MTIPLPWPGASLVVSLPWPGMPAWARYSLLAALVLTPLALAVALYLHEMRLVRRGTAAGLLSLRLGVLAAVLFLACLQPVLSRERTFEEPGRVLVVVDRSASLAVTDPHRSGEEKARLAAALRMPHVDGLTREELARRILAPEGMGLLGLLSSRHEVELWGMGREVREMKAEQLEEMFAQPAEDPVTDLASPLWRAVRRAGPGQGGLLGVVILTDGQHNSGPPAIEAAAEIGRHGVPVYPVILGSRRSPPDVAIASVQGAPRTFYKDVEGSIEVKVKIAGMPPGHYQVTLRDEEKKDEAAPPRTIEHDGKDRVHLVTFAVKLEAVGQRTLTAEVKPLFEGAQEVVTTNNRLSTTVSVSDDRIRVLLVDGQGRWEFHYLAAALERDRLVELKKILFEQPRLGRKLSPEAAEKAGLPSDRWPQGEDALGGFGCVILGDVGPDDLTLADRQRLERWVSEGGGTLVVSAGKRWMPLEYAEESSAGGPGPLSRLLPVLNPRALAPEEGRALTLTRAGEEQKFMELEGDREENAALWAGHPRPWGWAAVGPAKPGATVLASWLDPRDARLRPAERERRNAAVARQSYGFGRVLYVGVDSTWRLRYKAGDLYHHRFWGQVVRWAAGGRPLMAGNEWVRFGPSQPSYTPDEAVQVTARLSEKLGALKPGMLAGARVIALEGGQEKVAALVPLSQPAERPRQLDGEVRGLPPGSYALELVSPDLGSKLTSGGKPLRAPFRVEPAASAEMTELEANVPLLEEMAAKSGGRAFTAEEARSLADLLVKKSTLRVERREQRLYQWWGMLALACVLLTLEWAARKMAGLP